jgi:hypothetical protein
MPDFISYYSQLALELSRLLGVRFIPGRGLEGVVGKMLGGVIIYHNQGNNEFRDREITKLTLLASELNDIENFGAELLAQFRNMYRKNRADYYGFRMEVAAASLFIRRKITFKKNESPDFIVTMPNNEDVFVECGSAHLSKRKDKDIGYKIASAVSNKATMPYVNTRTALFLDITNIIHHTLISEIYLEQEYIESIVKKEMNGRQVGGTCLFFYMLDKEKAYFGYHLIRIDNDSVDFLLQEFLSEHFPKEGQETSNYDVPSIG